MDYSEINSIMGSLSLKKQNIENNKTNSVPFSNEKKTKDKLTLKEDCNNRLFEYTNQFSVKDQFEILNNRDIGFNNKDNNLKMDNTDINERLANREQFYFKPSMPIMDNLPVMTRDMSSKKKI